MIFPAGMTRESMDLFVRELVLAGYVCQTLGGIPIRGAHLITWRTIWVIDQYNKSIGYYTWHPHEQEYEWIPNPSGQRR